MLQPETSQYPEMSSVERERFAQAIAEEVAARSENVETAKALVPRLRAQCDQAANILTLLRDARKAASVSLQDLEDSTGICQSVLSDLEYSKAPNPTLAILQQYAEAVGKRIVFTLE